MNLQTEFEKNKSLADLKATSDPDLFVLKYKRKVFFDGTWNEFLENARGTIVDRSFNIVSYPFTKIYNFRVEKEAPVLPDSEVVAVFPKINGFMVAVTLYKDDLLVSTTGSIDSDFVGLAKQQLLFKPCHEGLLKICRSMPEHTFMFECVHQDDPHIVPEKLGLHFLGARMKSFGSMIEYPEFDWAPLKVVHALKYVEQTVGETVEQAKTGLGEGYVFYTLDGAQAAKIKTPHYLTKKMLMRRNMVKLMAPNAKELLLDEEFYPLYEKIVSEREAFGALDEQGRRQYIEDYFHV